MEQQKKQAAATTEEIIKTTIRLPKSLSDKLKHAAIDENTTSQELVEKALRLYFKQKAGRA